MFIVNPNFKTEVEKRAVKNIGAVENFLIANAENKNVSISELKAGLPSIAGDLTRPVVIHMCSMMGRDIGGTDFE